MIRKYGRSALAAGVLVVGMGAAVPAFADVKKGVEAWTRGDYAAAVREWADLAAMGDPDAEFNMAQAYRLGRGVDVDLDQAEALYAKAAAQGHLKAADNYGLLLFQHGERDRAMPYIEGAAERGDPRAQYLLGIAHFNGDLVAKDWRRAYALLTLANSAGLPQARTALVQMDEYIPLEDRQAAQTLAAALKTEAEARRARDLAEVDLALGLDTQSESATSMPAQPSARPQAAPPKVAGADYTLPKSPPAAAPVVVARAEPSPAPAPPVASPPQPAREKKAPVESGPWKVQLGAFAVRGNADRMWDQLSGRRELAGRDKIKHEAGKLTLLFAGGYATQADARAACSTLKSGGHDCLVTR